MKFILWVSSSSHVRHNSEQPAKLADLACFLDLVREGGAPKVVSVHNAHVAKLLLGLLVDHTLGDEENRQHILTAKNTRDDNNRNE